MIVWGLWLERNNWLFKNKFMSVDQLWEKIWFQINYIWETHTKVNESTQTELSNLKPWHPLVCAWNLKLMMVSNQAKKNKRREIKIWMSLQEGQPRVLNFYYCSSFLGGIVIYLLCAMVNKQTLNAYFDDRFATDFNFDMVLY